MLEDAKVMAIVPVHDLGKARTFWEKMVGLTPRDVHDPEGEVIYSLNGTELLVYRTQADLGGATKVTFVVKDLVEEMGTLKAHGVVFEDIDMPGLKTVNGVVEGSLGKAAWFRDLEENWIGLIQAK